MEEKETGVLQTAGFFVVMILEKSGFLYILYKFFIILCSGKQVQNRLNCIIGFHAIQTFSDVIHCQLFFFVQKQILSSGA